MVLPLAQYPAWMSGLGKPSNTVAARFGIMALTA
tara:strand:- start:84 stop:185 length:102 start_codon:yes stop_codon:yes gene_type:complete